MVIATVITISLNNWTQLCLCIIKTRTKKINPNFLSTNRCLFLMSVCLYSRRRFPRLKKVFSRKKLILMSLCVVGFYKLYVPPCQCTKIQTQQVCLFQKFKFRKKVIFSNNKLLFNLCWKWNFLTDSIRELRESQDVTYKLVLLFLFKRKGNSVAKIF